MKFNELEKIIDYKFSNRNLLKTAMTHSSYANEHSCDSYERLEFLGDSVLGYITAKHLFSILPEIPEGRMTRLRAELVCEESLHGISQKLGLGQYLLLGKGEELSGGRERASILADIVEAVIAAIYLDGGIEAAEKFVNYNLLRFADTAQTHKDKDYKTTLQEYVQAEGKILTYNMIGQSGPDHNKRFCFEVLIDGVQAGTGEGRSKKEAEQMAAGNALKDLEK